MHLHEVLGDGKTEAEAAVLSGRRRIGLLEAIEDVIQEARRDALTAVGDHELEMRLIATEHDANGSAAQRELGGVGQKIPDDLLEPPGIAGEDALGVEHHAETQALRLDGGTRRVDGGLDDARKRDGLYLEGKLARYDARDVEEVLDELRLANGVALDRL